MSDEKKIIVDEDWKSRVAAEKESLSHKQASADDVETVTFRPGEKTVAEQSPAATPASAPLMPPASFEMLVTTLATEAMIGLGQIPHPMSGEVHADAAQARYAIDMLEMLADKTKGNLSRGEDRGMRDLLHQLRMAFVAFQAAPASVTSVTSRAAETSGK